MRHERHYPCQLCGIMKPRSELVRKRFRYLQPEGQNHLAYSEYDENGWTYHTGSTASYVGDVSLGTDPTYVSVKYDGAGNATVSRGAPTFKGDVLLMANAVDIQTWSDVLVSIDIGPQQEMTTPILSVSVGIASDSMAHYTRLIYVQNLMEHRRLWAHSAVADLDSNIDLANANFYLYVYTGGSSTYEWWWENAQLEKDVTTQGTIVRSAGAATIFATDTVQETTVVVCPECKDSPLLRLHTGRRAPRKRVPEQIPYSGEEG